MVEYILSVLATLNVFLNTAFYFCLYFVQSFFRLLIKKYWEKFHNLDGKYEAFYIQNDSKI